MHRYIYLAFGLSLALSSCATPINDERRLTNMEKLPQGTYCIVDLPSGPLAITNQQALQVQYRLGDLPSCDLLYEVYYDYGALTARQQIIQLQQELRQLDRSIEQVRSDIISLEEMNHEH